jgi:glucose-6-phosphate isomerase, archaeal
MRFESGLAIEFDAKVLRFIYGDNVFGPEPEHRRLDAIRKSLREPGCSGPDPVYSIAMDVGRSEHRAELERRMLLFGVVRYAAGRLGHEPVRSQGHVHAVAPHCGWSTPEIFEVWEGRAIVYAQQNAADEPGHCLAIEVGVGEQAVVPPGWAHAVINAVADEPMVFGAWCDRQYGFEYDAVREHGGLAWFPLLDEEQRIHWEPNPRYAASRIECRPARTYPELGLDARLPLYEQFARAPETLQWVAEPARLAELWPSFQP